MALFQPSTKAVSATVQEIADTVGASGDTEMLTRAWRSLNAATEHFNNRSNWDYLMTDAPVVPVIAPFTAVITATGNSASVTASAGHGVKPMDLLKGDYFPPGTRVSATAATTIGIFGTTTGVTASVSPTLTVVRDMYDVPSDYKQMYSVRLNGTNTWLPQVDQRFADRAADNEFVANTPPAFYDLFMVGSQGKIKLIPPPNGADTLQMRYYRRMAVATATGSTAVLDIPQDYEPYLIAWSKWHFLVDKAEGRGAQLETWFKLAETGLTMMVKDQNRRPDMNITFIPGQFAYGNFNVNSTRMLDWNYS